ncbi:hypothetical protein Glove_321g29 [Diversispora epigaea]|uniref:Ribosomal L1 domain-containing protein 1 n=1 Tax=Diversispora epigaea TaxID=1348612 RepID=A0A397HNC8_9GLOM|nr:hypothetical protein Glove_321g29 [Diversispora epigaea]
MGEIPTLNRELIEKAVTILLKYVSKQNEKNENELITDPIQFVWLIVSTHKFSDENKAKPINIPLKHPLYNSSTEICLITKDPQKDFKELVINQEAKNVKKVIGLSKLRKKYHPYEAKRLLCDSYDLFLADDRVINYLPKLLGKKFFEKKKQPIPVNLKDQKNFKKEIFKACNSTYMHFRPGTCLAIKIGTTDMTALQILENIEMGVSKIVDKIPKKWLNIQSLNIKTNTSTSLPIFNVLPHHISYEKKRKHDDEKDIGDKFMKDDKNNNKVRKLKEKESILSAKKKQHDEKGTGDKSLKDAKKDTGDKSLKDTKKGTGDKSLKDAKKNTGDKSLKDTKNNIKVKKLKEKKSSVLSSKKN